MSSCKLLFFFMGALMVFFSISGQARAKCQKPEEKFRDIESVYKYIDCIKAQGATRYGKRAPAMMEKLPPGLYNYEDLEQLYDMLYNDN